MELANAADIHRVAFLGFKACGFFRWLKKATGEGFGIPEAAAFTVFLLNGCEKLLCPLEYGIAGTAPVLNSEALLNTV